MPTENELEERLIDVLKLLENEEQTRANKNKREQTSAKASKQKRDNAEKEGDAD